MIHPALKNPEHIAIAVLAILHAVGAVGTLLGFGYLLLPLSGLNLLLAAGLLIAFNAPSLGRWGVMAPLAGFAAEVIGVQTGWLFGSYSYGDGLGWKWAGVPLLLGLLWLMMLWGAAVVVDRLKPDMPRWGRAAAAAAAMTALDGLIEPVAVQSGWWTWANGTIPLTNFISWFTIAFPLLLFAPRSEGRPGTSVALALFLIFGIFFTLLNLFEWTLASPGSLPS